MLRNAVQWRKEIGLDGFKKWTFPPHFYTDMKFRYYGRDLEGAPICWLFAGTWPVKQLLESEDLEQLKRYCFGGIEQGFQLMIKYGSTGNVIIDMEGFSYLQGTDIGSLKFAYSIFQGFEQYFPEILKAIYIINAPWIFSFTFNFFKGAFAQRTMGKTTIFSYKEEWHAEFLKRFPRESIIPELQPPYSTD
ncbi:putative SEC14-like protein 6 [Orchesella cincta]|uniref:Putative SEC14-like protein 6 n=1 Tax=Orchesella cincta TaxID=48709 RepID=A0A1D2MNA4_ORCCI|nr:putative SEC14-like protein 6 [Orchesella cincta]